MATQRVGLKLVDPDTGEITEHACPHCAEKQFVIEGLTRKNHGLLAENGRLRKELAPSEGHELFPVGKRLHDLFKEIVKHPFHKAGGDYRNCPACKRTKFTTDRFEEIRPRLQEYGDEGEELCRKAIEGARYDPFTVRRRNGSVHRHNDWHQIFHPDKFMEFCNKAPVHLPSPEAVKTLANALMFLGWNEPDQAVAEAQRRLRK